MINIFDMMGPVMVGPSSSHTAGAARIGNMGRTLLGEEVARADIGLHGQHLDAVEAFQLLLGCFQLLDIAACDDEVRALLGVCGGDAVADGAAAPILQDSAPCAGNDGGFTS